MNLAVPQKKSPMDNSKQREYLKQQHQLRTMTKSSAALSADDMIENLLSKKEIFQKKKDGNQERKNSLRMDPMWLSEGNEPIVYRKIWEQVCTPSGMTETPKLSNILLGSGLGTDTLGYIWSLTNTTISGSLTQVELYRTLALVALAQKGYSFTNFLVLNQFHEAPIPRLDLRPSVPIVSSNTTASTAASGQASIFTQSPSSIQVPTVTETLSLMDTLSEPLVPSTSSTVPCNSFSVLSATDLNKLTAPTEPEDDEFDDFKSAEIFSTDSLKVLNIKESDNNQESGTSAGDLFKKNMASFFLVNGAKDGFPEEVGVETEEKYNENNPNKNSNMEKRVSTAVAISSLQEALREDLTLAPVSLSCLPPSLPVASDRYNALRQLSAADDDRIETSSNVLYDDFGDFITATHLAAAEDTNVASASSISSLIVDPNHILQSDVQEKCLEACVHVLREANDVFKSIEDAEVLNEVISDDRGKKYLEEIIEVERIGRRIISSKTVQADDCELSKQLVSLCKALEPFLKPLEHSHMEEEKGAKCGLCLCEIGPAHVKYGINQFHAPCANLFLHVVGEPLPLTPVT